MKLRIVIALLPFLLLIACGSAEETAVPEPTLAAAVEVTAAPAVQASATAEPAVAPADALAPEEEAPTATPMTEAEATEAPTAADNAEEQPASSPTDPAAPEVTQEATATTPPEPTEAPAATVAPQISGSAGFRDSLGVADQFVVNLSALPAPPDGQTYQGWLVGDDGTIASIGVLDLNPDGSLAHEWTSQNGENLLGRYTRFQVTLEPAAGSASPTGQVMVSGGLEGVALDAARRLFVRNDGEPATPLGTAFALGLKAQSNAAAAHVQNAANAAAIGALAEMQHHLEHTVNILEGQAGPRHGDHTGDNTAENPGDGFGVVGYSSEIAQLLSDRQSVADHAATVRAQSTAIQDKALDIMGIQDIATASAQLAELMAMADQLKAGPVAGLYGAARDAISFEISASP